MEADKKQQLVVALQKWVEAHPEPDAVILHAGSKSYTPRMILDEFQNDATGNSFISDLFDNALTHSSVEELVESFGREFQTSK